MLAALCETLSNNRGAYCFNLKPYEVFTKAISLRGTTFCEVIYLRMMPRTLPVVSLFFSHWFTCSRVAFSGGFWLRNFVTSASALAICLFSLAWASARTCTWRVCTRIPPVPPCQSGWSRASGRNVFCASSALPRGCAPLMQTW